MGNNSCTLVIRTEQQHCIAGSQCNGRIYLSVNKDFVPCHALRLRFKGHESAQVHHHHDSSYSEDERSHHHDHQEDHYETNTCVILEQDHILHTCTSPALAQTGVTTGFQRGQYEFPFQFTIPHGLPSSMHFRSGESYCQVQYELVAYLQQSNSGGFMNTFQRNHGSKCPIIVYSNLNFTMTGNEIPSPIHFPSETHRINFWCCLNRGQMRLEAQLKPESDSTPATDFNARVPTLLPNIPYTLTCQASNESTVPVKSIRIELVEQISFKPKYREERGCNVIVKQSVDGAILGTQYYNRKKGGDYAQVFPPSTYAEAILGGERQSFRLLVPIVARDSYNGQIIQVRHFLRIQLITGCCITTPETSIDVEIAHFSSSTTPPSGIQMGLDGMVNEMILPTAPPMESIFGENDPVVVEATALPNNWSPQTADLIDLPIATAIPEYGTTQSFVVEASGSEAS